MIPRDYITAWHSEAPWVQDFQVEQDLIVSKALIDVFSEPRLRKALAFRGGTALYKLYLKPPLRYSEDIDWFRSMPDRRASLWMRCGQCLIPGLASRAGNKPKGAGGSPEQKSCSAVETRGPKTATYTAPAAVERSSEPDR